MELGTWWQQAVVAMACVALAIVGARAVAAEIDSERENEARGISIKPKGEIENWVLHQTHPFFGHTSRTWAETSGRFGLTLTAGTLTVEARTLGVHTWGDDPYGTGTPPAGTDRGGRSRSTAPDFELEHLFARVNDVFGLPVEVTVGRQDIKVGTLFLFGDGVYDGFSPGTQQGVYHSPRHYLDAVRIRAQAFGNDLDAFAYRVDPTWDSGFGDDGVLGGAELSRKLESIAGTYAGGVFYRSSRSNEDNDMLILDARIDQPLPWAGGSYFGGEAVGEIGKCHSVFYCNEPDGHTSREYAWHAELGIHADTVPLQPFAEAGYVYYSTDFAPIAYGFHDWGKWYLGNQIDWLLFGTNSRIVRTDLGLWPLATVQARFLYFNTREVTRIHETRGGTLSDEFTWVVSWFPTEWLWALVAVGYSIPRADFTRAEFEDPFLFVNSGAAGVADEASVDITTAFGIRF